MLLLFIYLLICPVAWLEITARLLEHEVEMRESVQDVHPPGRRVAHHGCHGEHTATGPAAHREEARMPGAVNTEERLRFTQSACLSVCLFPGEENIKQEPLISRSLRATHKVSELAVG